MRIRYAYTWVMIAALALGACSNPKAANDKDFEKAIVEYLKHKEAAGEFCLHFFASFPFESSSFIVSDPAARAGLLQKVGEQGSGWSRRVFVDLSEKGRKCYIPGVGFRYGEPRFVRIASFSKPSSFGPYTMSKVNYEYRVVDIPQWARELAAPVRPFGFHTTAYPNIIAAISSEKAPIKDEATLILTNDGWVHENLFKK